MAKLLLLEDEIDLREELAAYFSAQGHQVTQVGSIADFRNVMAVTPELCEIAIIDRGLPDGDGLVLVSDLRGPGLNQFDRGIIVFTGRGDSTDKIDGLMRGADHYLSKPVRLPELGAVLAALVRRLSPRLSWRLCVSSRSLQTPCGRDVDLTTLEFAFLNMLAQASGRPVSRKTIAIEFGEDYLTYDQNRLDTLVTRLRRKVESETGKTLPVHTVRVVGFVFADQIIIQA